MPSQHTHLLLLLVVIGGQARSGSNGTNESSKNKRLQVPTSPANTTTSTPAVSGENCNGQTNSDVNNNNNDAALVATKINITLDILALQMVEHLKVKERNHHSQEEDIDKHNNVTINSSLGDARLPSQ